METITIWATKMKNGTMSYWKRFDEYQKTYRISKSEYEESKEQGTQADTLINHDNKGWGAVQEMICYYN